MLALFSLLCCVFLASFSGCKKKIDYFDYVSELRSNILLAENDSFVLRIYAVEKENPYVSDGIPKETAIRTEIFLTAPSGEQLCTIDFSIKDKKYGGEMSYDCVKAEYYFSCSLNLSNTQEVVCDITYGEQKVALTAKSVLNEKTLSPTNVLQRLQKTETELFHSLTDKFGFKGEIYLRLIFEELPYYYVGIIDREGNVYAFLINAETGKIVAKRKS